MKDDPTGINLEKAIRPLSEAIAFAARAHRGQLRKDERTPYVSHVFRVCLIVRDVFAIEDRQVLMAAALHDTLEDTTTDHDELREHFGAEVADWVAVLSKDKRLPEAERERVYCEGLARAPWQVKVCKLGDILDNLMDSVHLPAAKRSRSVSNAHRYLAAMQTTLTVRVQHPWEQVARFLAEFETNQAAAVT